MLQAGVLHGTDCADYLLAGVLVVPMLCRRVCWVVLVALTVAVGGCAGGADAV